MDNFNLGFRVGIIGGLGVGAAHAVSLICSRLVSHLVVCEPHSFEAFWKAKQRYQNGTVTNEWGDIEESVAFPTARVTVTNRLEDLFECDYIVIATPTRTHSHIILRLQEFISEYVRIVCEKPFDLNPMELENFHGLHCSLEWSFHAYASTLQTYVTETRQYHPEATVYLKYNQSKGHKDPNPVSDLLPHLLSLLPTEVLKASTVEFVRLQKNPSLGTAYYEIGLSTSVHLLVSFDDEGSDREEITFGIRNAGSSEFDNLVTAGQLTWDAHEKARHEDMFSTMHTAYLTGSDAENQEYVRMAQKVNSLVADAVQMQKSKASALRVVGK